MTVGGTLATAEDHRFLAGTRLATQGIGLVWFVVAARVLRDDEMAALALGLFTFGIVSVVADLGATWSVVRVVAGGAGPPFGAFREASTVRTVATALAAVLATASAGALGLDVKAVAVGSAIAAASGITEVGFAALRSVGHLRSEGLLRLGERTSFFALAASVLLLGGRSGFQILLIYAITNTVAAAGVTGVLRAVSPGAQKLDRGVLWNAETARTAIAYAVLSLAPRVAAVTLVVFSSEVEVSAYAVVARPVEAIALLLISLASPALPALRQAAVTGQQLAAKKLTGHFVCSTFLVAVPILAWCAADGADVLTVLVGGGRYSTAVITLAVVACLAVSWPIRAIVGYALLAQDRSRRYALTGAIQLVCLVAFAVPATATHGAAGAATAVVVSDLIALVMLAPWRQVALGNNDKALVLRGALVASIISLSTPLLSLAPSIVVALSASLWAWFHATRAFRELDGITALP